MRPASDDGDVFIGEPSSGASIHPGVARPHRARGSRRCRSDAHAGGPAWHDGSLGSPWPALTTVALVGPGAGTAFAFTAGDNGHPTSGPYSDLKGGTATFTFQANATLTCNKDDGATGFDFKLNYTNANLPAGATIVVYLSPNQGAINGNAGGDA